MPRYRDTRTGVIVEVDEVTGAALNAAYEPVKGTPKPAKKVAASSAKSDE